MFRGIAREIRHYRWKKQAEREYQRWAKNQSEKGLPSSREDYKKAKRKEAREGLKEEAKYAVQHPVETAAKAFFIWRMFK